MRKLMVVMVLVLAACAKPSSWAKDGATPDSFAKDKRECEYDAVRSVQGYDPTMRSSFGQEYEQAGRRNEVAKACMRSRGYSEVRS